MTVPYASATSGKRARDELEKILLRLGCEKIGFMDDYQNHEVMLQFTHRGRPFQIKVSAKGWAQTYLKKNPWTYQHRRTRAEYEQAALDQGYVAINSILRDLIKGQITAIECGIVSLEAVFMPFMLTLERLRETNLLPAPEEPRIVSPK